MLVKTVQKFVDASLIVLLCMLWGNAGAGETTRVSINSIGEQRLGFTEEIVDISANGRFVVFSTSSNLVVEDTNATGDVYVHDRLSHEIKRVSVRTNGTQATNKNSSSFSPRISDDGRIVTFISTANLDSKDTNSVNVADAYTHDLLTHQTKLVSIGSNGMPANSGSYGSNLSADGRFVVFESDATNLVDGDTNGQQDIFVHDRLIHKTTRVNVHSNGMQANAGNSGYIVGYKSSISSDGRFVAFSSLASNLVDDDTNEGVQEA